MRLRIGGFILSKTLLKYFIRSNNVEGGKLDVSEAGTTIVKDKFGIL